MQYVVYITRLTNLKAGSYVSIVHCVRNFHWKNPPSSKNEIP